jgi:hypothetical protein
MESVRPSHREVGLVVSLNVSSMSERLEILRYMIERQQVKYTIERLEGVVSSDGSQQVKNA